jgi:hypothetical protein
MHEIKFIDQAQPLEQLEGPVHGSSINSTITFTRQFKQGRSVKVMGGFLNGLDQEFSLAGNADATQRQLLEQRATLESTGLHFATSCDSVATASKFY